MRCLKPRLSEIPQSAWYCPKHYVVFPDGKKRRIKNEFYAPFAKKQPSMSEEASHRLIRMMLLYMILFIKMEDRIINSEEDETEPDDTDSDDEYEEMKKFVQRFLFGKASQSKGKKRRKASMYVTL
jgi:hypothetical protein